MLFWLLVAHRIEELKGLGDTQKHERTATADVVGVTISTWPLWREAEATNRLNDSWGAISGGARLGLS